MPRLLENRGRITRLIEKLKKTTAVTCWSLGVLEVRRFSLGSVPEISSITVVDAAQYAGILVGPGAGTSRSKEQFEKFWIRVIEVAKVQGNILQIIRRCRFYALSTSQYLASLCWSHPSLSRRRICSSPSPVVLGGPSCPSHSDTSTRSVCPKSKASGN
jgi:hypothetical protein